MKRYYVEKINNINEITVTNSNVNCLISTITASKPGENVTQISKEYFMTQDQNVNTLERTKNPEDWGNMKKIVKKEIDTLLKIMMILKAQELGLAVNDWPVRNFADK